MGYAGKLSEKLLAQKLRKKGYSYKEILKRINVSKSTISLWCRDIALSPTQALRLSKKKLQGAAKGRIIGAKKQQQRRLAETKELLKKGRSEVGRMTKRDRFIAGIALYAAEGTKQDGRVDFSNTDPKLIKFMMSWFREFCRIKEEKFRGSIWIHENRNEARAKRFWSRTTGIPLKQFHKSYIAENKTSSKKIRKHIHKYGVFGIRLVDVKAHRRIMGWISGVSGGSMV